MHRPEIPSLTGLRFYAAGCVLWAHSVATFFIPAGIPVLKDTNVVGSVGMTLFFVLSGFVIHYNYGATVGTLKARPLANFAIARFARLYPLFLLCVVITIAMHRTPPASLAEAWPFYLTMTHDWIDRTVTGIPLGDLYAPGSWSISAEVLLYLFYIPMAYALRRLRSCRVILGAIIALVAVVTLFYVGRIAGWWWAAPNYWLFYRSPWCRLTEFGLGALVAALYCARSEVMATVQEHRYAALAMLLGGAWVVGLLIATGLPWVKNPAAVLLESWGLAPSAAALIYYLARFKSPLSAWTENKMAIMLGEASYSIYLLHWVFVWVFTSSVVDANALLLPKLLLAWLMTMLLALGCYRYFEWPARLAIRRAMVFPANVSARNY
jgi:peptidoglycan/LPS O-acetylase OafA/YrhL